MPRVRIKKEFDPFEKPTKQAGGPETTRVLIEVLCKLLQGTRVRAQWGWKPNRCLACDRPHTPTGKCPVNCVHHEAVELLKTMGVDAYKTP